MAQENGNPPIEWFLSFINTDLERFTVSDRMKLQAEMADAFGVPIEPQTFSAPVNPEWVPVMLVAGLVTLKSLQQEFKKILSALVMRLEGDRSQQGSAIKVYISPEDYLTSTRLKTMSLKIELTLCIEPMKPPELVSKEAQSNASSWVHWNPESFSNSLLDIKASSQNVESLMMYHFFQALKGLPSNSLNSCQECGKWFCRTSLRGKAFCSSRCATKKANKIRYDKKKGNLLNNLER